MPTFIALRRNIDYSNFLVLVVFSFFPLLRQMIMTVRVFVRNHRQRCQSGIVSNRLDLGAAKTGRTLIE